MSEFEQRPVRWENPTTARFYEAALQRNLFGKLELLLVWGGISSTRGGHRCTPMNDAAQAATELAVLSRLRERRGYGLRRLRGAHSSNPKIST